MEEVQDKVKRLVTKYNLNGDVNIKYIDLTSEIGELGKELLNGSDYGSKRFEKTEDAVLELGDVFFSLVCVANELDIDMGKALDAVLLKYAKRFDEKSNIGSGR